MVRVNIIVFFFFFQNNLLIHIDLIILVCRNSKKDPSKRVAGAELEHRPFAFRVTYQLSYPGPPIKPSLECPLEFGGSETNIFVDTCPDFFY